MNPKPQVTCILVNWNRWQDTLECLEALSKSTYTNVTTIVVDNGSTDDSVSRIKVAYPAVLLLESGSNLGFAGGNNIGIRKSLENGADFVWLLNNDTKPAPDALAALVGKALSGPKIGAVSSVCYYASTPSVVQVWAGAQLNLWIGYGKNSTEPHPDTWFDSLYGASMLITTDALREVGLLDQGFFHYWEETEFCLRLRKNRWRLAAAPDSHILHKVGKSTGDRYLLDRYFTASGLRLLRRHSPAPVLAMILFVLIRMTRRILRLRFALCRSVWEGVQDYRHSSHIPQIH